MNACCIQVVAIANKDIHGAGGGICFVIVIASRRIDPRGETVFVGGPTHTGLMSLIGLSTRRRRTA
jgi:hypothetical protein